ncbi:hypothetical protein IF1G_01262 [Cordyceps javanica]|uniref:Uncharacterized protein n=1 Tax=Cordyceps javanica TaxID=43265 RepID=A0A545VHY2_9HYPO|nr:hypothetical protein IF1G_01262 [Cordyceps javanica]
MREAQDQTVVWEETDEDTFIRFAEYAYTGSYSEGRPRQRPMRDEKPDLPESEKPKPTPAPAASTHRRRIKSTAPVQFELDVPSTSKKEELWSRFTTLYPPTPRTTETFVNNAKDDCSEVFLSHARVH